MGDPTMNPQSPPPRRLTRRTFLVVAGAAAGLAAVRSPAGAAPPEGLAGPVLTTPEATANGAKVPIVVQMAHPMDADHHVVSLAVVNERDPVPAKGVFHFTPMNGELYVAFQVRVDEGVQTLRVAAECNRGARWASASSVRVAEGAGGCVGAAPPPAARPAAPRPPVIRLPDVVRGRRLEAGRVIDVQVQIQHAIRTGLALRGGQYVQVSEPFYLREMEVFHGAIRVSRFALTPALADDPLLTFRLRPLEEGVLRVVFRNSRGADFEASYPIRFG
jgi:predicted secreted protein